MPEFVAPEPLAQDRERARVAIGDDLAALVHHPSAVVLLALLFVYCWNEKIYPAKFSKRWASASRCSKAIVSNALSVFIRAGRDWLLSG